MINFENIHIEIKSRMIFLQSFLRIKTMFLFLWQKNNTNKIKHKKKKAKYKIH